jgi:phosphate:Na+ symporter
MSPSEQCGTLESIETSGMHLEIARGLKKINSLLVTVAYLLLTKSGDLLESRLARASYYSSDLSIQFRIAIWQMD